LGILAGSSGDLDDIKVKVASAGFEVRDSREIYPGSCTEFMARVAETVHTTIDTMDYDGLKPYIKMLDELDSGKSLFEMRLSSEKDERGSICTGISLAIIRNIFHEHHVRCMLAATDDLGHAVLIMECQNGYVLIDNRSNRAARLFAAPFNREVKCSFPEIGIGGDPILITFSLKAGPPGSSIPLIQTFGDGPLYQLCTNIADVEDLIAKCYIQHGISEFIPIAVYREDGRPRKAIKVSPSRNEVKLKDHLTGYRKTFTFEQILAGDLSVEELKAFMGKAVFHSKRRTIHEEIIRVVSQIERIKALFAHLIPL
jgi:hypothetical protein